MSGTEEASVGIGTPQSRQTESMADSDDSTVLDAGYLDRTRNLKNNGEEYLSWPPR